MKSDPKTVIDISQDAYLSRVHGLPEPKTNAGSGKRKDEIFNIPKYNWVRDKLDKRDYKYRVTGNTQPNIVDLRPYCTSVENQGNLGSCTGNAIAGAIELLIKRTNRLIDVSRLYIYYYARLIEGNVNYDSGAYIRDGIKATYTYGAPLERLWPYDVKKFRLRPNATAIQDASKRKVTLYERINDHNGCLDALSNGYPVVVGFDVYSSFEKSQVSRTGIMPYPDVNRERYLGGHAVLLVGYDKSRNHYIARNSWGVGWGDRGYFYMPFQVIQNKNMSGDFWIIKSVNNP